MGLRSVGVVGEPVPGQADHRFLLVRGQIRNTEEVLDHHMSFEKRAVEREPLESDLYRACLAGLVESGVPEHATEHRAQLGALPAVQNPQSNVDAGPLLLIRQVGTGEERGKNGTLWLAAVSGQPLQAQVGNCLRLYGSQPSSWLSKVARRGSSSGRADN